MRTSALICVAALTLPLPGFAQQKSAPTQAQLQAHAQARCDKIKQSFATACAKSPQARSCAPDAMKQHLAKAGCS